MLRSLPFGRTVVALLAIGFLALIAVGAASVYLGNRAATDARRVTEAQAVQGAAIAVYIAVRETESGQRGYLVTDEPEYRTVYQIAERGAAPALAALERLIRNDPEHTADLRSLSPLVRAKLAETAETVRLAQAGRKREAVAMVKTDDGRTMMFQIGGLLQQIILREDAALKASQRSSQRTSRLLLIVNLIGLVLVVGLAAVSLTVIGRSLHELRSAGRELRRTNEGLEHAVEDRTQEIRRANEEIQRFAYIVSHDLRSPLVNVMGFTSELDGAREPLKRQLALVREKAPELLLADAVTAVEEELPESVGFIRASTAKMDRLINAILQISRDGRRTLTPAPVAMRAVLEQIAASLTVTAERADAEIVIEDVPDLVSDRLAIEQIFSNLIENAIKYRQPGRAARVVVRGRIAGPQVVYEVEDNGRGIDAKDYGRVFELFRRAGRQDQPGEGLGLAFVQTGVRRLGGGIDLRSVAGEGSTFTLTFPKVLKATETELANAA